MAQPYWIGLAEVDDHRLTPEDPLWVDCGDADEPSTLEVYVHKALDVGILLRGGYEFRYGDYLFTSWQWG